MRGHFVQMKDGGGKLIRPLSLGPRERSGRPRLDPIQFIRAADVLSPWPEVARACREHDFAAQHRIAVAPFRSFEQMARRLVWRLATGEVHYEWRHPVR